MGLGDLLNLDYGYALDGGPTWDFGTTGYSLGGPELSTPQIMSDQFGMGPMRGTDFTLGVDGIDGAAMRPSVFEFDASGQPQTLGFRGADGMVETLDGNRIAANPFGIAQAGGSALKKLLDQLAKAGGSDGSGGGGGGGNVGVSMPSIDSPVAERIGAVPVPAVQTGALPAAPAPSSEFRPLVSDVATPREPDLQGLQRLFADSLRRAR